jgi:quercetin dioxygenase-like cupin family protein
MLGHDNRRQDGRTTRARHHHRPVAGAPPPGTGATYLGPGDVFRFLVTGAETGSAYFALEAIVAPGGGPPPHIHCYEDETFYILGGECRLLLADEWITAGVGDFINVPRGTCTASTTRAPRPCA